MKRILNSKSNYVKVSSMFLAFAFFLLAFLMSFFKLPLGFSNSALAVLQISEEEPTLPSPDDPSESETDPETPPTDEEQYIDYTVFIRNSTFSTIFNNKAFLIDEEVVEENKIYTLKAYNLETSTFEQKYLVLNNITNIVDASYINGKFVLLTETSIFLVSLDTDLFDTDEACKEIDITAAGLSLESYSAISTYNYDDGTNNEYFILLTPLAESEESNNLDPKILICNENFELSETITVNISIAENESIVKFFAISGKTEGSINLIFVTKTSVYYFKTERNSILTNLSAGSSNKFSTELDKTTGGVNTSVALHSANIIVSETTPYLLITYEEVSGETISNYAKIYEISIGTIDNAEATYLREKDDFALMQPTDYTITAENYFIYTAGQIIRYIELDFSDENDPYIPVTHEQITNPKIEIEYYDEADFIYNQTIASTNILVAPWSPLSSDEAVSIDAEIDVVEIGRGYIKSNGKLYLKDYIYCLYTVSDINYTGYIESKDLTTKQALVEENKLTLTKYNKILKAKPNAALYSLPTKVTGDQITSELTSSIVENIKDNSRIEFIDHIYCYTSNNSIFVKVKVNNNNIGYIEVDSLIPPSDKNAFVLTNSYIKNDGTKVYLEEDENSPVIYLLESDKRVRINGTRNTKTGFTYITFNDEFGNEFSGYIKNEQTKSDHWSTLQIIGCILIAINIGLLILIIYYRDTRIGVHGEKYDKSKKSN